MVTKPQLDNGFIQIATGSKQNDILSALISANLTATEYQVVLTVIRKTWGWKKQDDWISISQFVGLTGKSKRSVIGAAGLLVQKNILVKQTALGIKTIYSFNKDFSSWVVQHTALVQNTAPVQFTARTGAKYCTGVVQQTAHTKETITKETIQKKERASLHELNDSHFQPIAEKYSVPISFVRSKYDDMINWAESNGKRKNDWIATLRNWVKKDAVQIRKEQNAKSSIVRASL